MAGDDERVIGERLAHTVKGLGEFGGFGARPLPEARAPCGQGAKPPSGPTPIGWSWTIPT